MDRGLPLDVPDVRAVREDTRARARGFLDEVRAELLVEEAPGLAGVPVQLIVPGGPAAEVLVHRAAGADLLVVGSRGRGRVRSVVLGSVALHCVTHAPCPVVVVHEAPAVHRPGGPVVVGIDGSTASTAALREAVIQARGLGSALDVVTACSVGDYWSDVYAAFGPTEEQLRAAVREEAERVLAGVTAEERAAGRPVPDAGVRLVEGPAREVLVREAEQAAALVVGSRGHGTLRGLLLGSVALHCAVHARAPVTVVHPDDRPAPVAEVAAAVEAPA